MVDLWIAYFMYSQAKEASWLIYMHLTLLARSEMGWKYSVSLRRELLNFQRPVLLLSSHKLISKVIKEWFYTGRNASITNPIHRRTRDKEKTQPTLNIVGNRSPCIIFVSGCWQVSFSSEINKILRMNYFIASIPGGKMCTMISSSVVEVQIENVIKIYSNNSCVLWELCQDNIKISKKGSHFGLDYKGRLQGEVFNY